VFSSWSVLDNGHFRRDFLCPSLGCDNIPMGYALVAMSRDVLDHHLEGEKKRLALMSSLLNPLHRRLIESLGISRDARVLEVGCGNGSMSAWMAKHIAPDGQEFSPTFQSSHSPSRRRIARFCCLG
jgi:hypothetical protein